MDWTAADMISMYSRAQAISDGVLVDVTPMAKEVGVRFPVAVTQGLWAEIVPNESDEKLHGQSTQGRLWDVLWLFRQNALRTKASLMSYTVLMVENGKHKTVTVKGLVHPGDDNEPVITLMLPHED